MQKIYKQILKPKDTQVVELQTNRILSVKEQRENIVVYYVFNDDINPVKYEFGVNGTGNNIEFDIDNFEFLDTVAMYGGEMMFHVFYRIIDKQIES